MKKTYFLLVIFGMLQAFVFASTPEITTRLTEAYPVEMPELRAYPIYMSATVEDPFEITEVKISINGVEESAVADVGFYYYLWYPETYGAYEIIMTATASDGSETSITRNVEVVATATSQMVRSLENVVIEFTGANDRWYYGTHTFPQFVGARSEERRVGKEGRQ